MKSSEFKVRVQAFGRFLSGMVMPNIGVFIAWGLLTALFIPTGWFPNEQLAKMVGPMIAGPVGGYVIKKFDKKMKGKIKSGFEMLVNNFSAGIVGLILAVIFFYGVGPVVEQLNTLLGVGVNRLVQARLLPLTSLVVEPAKVLFLNNAINHGVFGPLGIQQVSETGKSLFFLIEANPGPGLGVLLAYMMFGKGASKESASGAAIIHFFGGIHEIYFPYILMKPMLIVSLVFGGMTGVFIFEIALEATRNITDNFELGLGVAYQNHAKPKSNSETTIYSEIELETLETKMPKFDSVPLYAIAKYNFETGTAWKPYLKATLGYSINFEDGDAKELETYVYDGNTSNDTYKYKTDAKNGLYYGIGAGVEYENFFADLMYQVNEAKIKITDEYEGVNYGSAKKDFDYSRVTLGFGYKFSF